jgi:serine/threonine-protein phosphatase 2B catalytic subunit
MEPLLDPVGDRVMKDIIPPPHRPLSDEQLYPNKSKKSVIVNQLVSNAPNCELLKSHMYREGRVSKAHC